MFTKIVLTVALLVFAAGITLVLVEKYRPTEYHLQTVGAWASIAGFVLSAVLGWHQRQLVGQRSSQLGISVSEPPCSLTAAEMKSLLRASKAVLKQPGYYAHEWHYKKMITATRVVQWLKVGGADKPIGRKTLSVLERLGDLLRKEGVKKVFYRPNGANIGFADLVQERLGVEAVHCGPQYPTDAPITRGERVAVFDALAITTKALEHLVNDLLTLKAVPVAALVVFDAVPGDWNRLGVLPGIAPERIWRVGPVDLGLQAPETSERRSPIDCWQDHQGLV